MESTIRAIADKQKILSQAGYRYSFDREVYFNSAAKKAFSVAFIQDHSDMELTQLIESSTLDASKSGWHFFFNQAPSAAVEQQLAALLG